MTKPIRALSIQQPHAELILRGEKKIKFMLSHVITEISGGKQVDAVTVKSTRDSAQSKVACDGLFIYIGYEPDTSLVKNKLQLDDAGFIITTRDLKTSVAGVFAAGDCRQKTLYQVITACSDGAIAADSAYKHISTL